MKTKQIIYIALLFTFFINCNDKVESIDLDAEKKEVEKTLVEYFKYVEQRNWDSLRALSQNDLIIFESGIIWNNDSLINAVDGAFKDFEISYDLDFIKTEVDNSIAWTYYNSKAEAVSDSARMIIKWLESASFKKQAGKWKVSFIHSTTVGQPKIEKKEN